MNNVLQDNDSIKEKLALAESSADQQDQERQFFTGKFDQLVEDNQNLKEQIRLQITELQQLKQEKGTTESNAEKLHSLHCEDKVLLAEQ